MSATIRAKTVANWNVYDAWKVIFLIYLKDKKKRNAWEESHGEKHNWMGGMEVKSGILCDYLHE